MMSRKILFALALTALITVPAMAQNHPKEAPAVKQARMPGDADRDGRVSKEEYAAASAKAFARMDADKDGYLTREEKASYDAARLAGRKKSDVKADAEKSGFMSRFFGNK